MAKLSSRLRVTMTALIVVGVIIGALGFALAAVAAMRTVNTVESLEIIHAGSTPSSSTNTSETSTPRPTPSPTQTIAASGKTDSPTYDVTITPGKVGTPLQFNAMLASLLTDDAPEIHLGYVRDYFNAWVDANGDGCNTRAEVLMLESLIPTTRTGKCTINSGSWTSPYDGTSLSVASKLDIDHFVPLSEAWKSGAYAWDSATRTAYGNDLGYSLSLVAVTASSNRSKGDKDPSQWMPPQHGYYCDYASTWVAVKWRWSLTVDTLERRSLQAVLDGCTTSTIDIPHRATIVLLTADQLATQNQGAAGGNSAQSGSAASGALPDNGSIDPNYGTCKVAKANGAGPYIKGTDTEYEWYRDADKDGTVCE